MIYLHLNATATRYVLDSYHSMSMGTRDRCVVRPIICGNCAWVSVCLYMKGASIDSGEFMPTCPRPLDAPLSAVFSRDKNARECQIADILWLDETAPRVADSLIATYTVGGINACIKLIAELEKVDVGLDDPGGRKDYESVLERCRPDSYVEPKR